MFIKKILGGDIFKNHQKRQKISIYKRKKTYHSLIRTKLIKMSAKIEHFPLF